MWRKGKICSPYENFLFYPWKKLIRRGIHILFILFLKESICCEYTYSLEVPHHGASNEYPQHMFLWRNQSKSKSQNHLRADQEQEAHGPQLAHLSETATADMQMACNIFPILLWQGNGLNSFWNILLTRLKCWNFLNVTSKISHPQCLLPTFESTCISVQ